MAAGLPLLIVTGTTGSGKNRLGAHAARCLGGEVLSLDSMKVYRGMDIGTAKPSRDLMRLAPHHLVDVRDPGEHMDLAVFLSEAEKIIREVHGRRRPVVVVGGTAMYLMGLLYGVHGGPPRDEDFRAGLRRERDELGVRALHDRLARVDAASAARIDPNDYQRIERALEMYALTGQPASAHRRDWFRRPRFPFLLYTVTWPRDVLRARIEERVDAMMQAGWLDEVRGLMERSPLGPQALQALGYKELIRHIEDGTPPLDEVVATIKTRTWQFARRQLTWMRKFEQAVRIERKTGDQEDLIARFVNEFRPAWTKALAQSM